MNLPISDDAVAKMLVQVLSLISVKGYRNPVDGLFYSDLLFTNILNSDKRAIHYDLIEKKNYTWNGSTFVFAGSDNNYISLDKNFVDYLKTVVPDTATDTNQLATKSFVNTLVNEQLGDDLTKNARGDPFDTKAELLSAVDFYRGGQLTQPHTKDTVVVLEDESHNGSQTRYLYQSNSTSTSGTWNFYIKINDTPFTEAQRNAINSTITKAKVDNYDAFVSKSRKYTTELIGDGSTTEFYVDHNLNSWDVYVVAYDANNFSLSLEVQLISENRVKIAFGSNSLLQNDEKARVLVFNL